MPSAGLLLESLLGILPFRKIAFSSLLSFYSVVVGLIFLIAAFLIRLPPFFESNFRKIRVGILLDYLVAGSRKIFGTLLCIHVYKMIIHRNIMTEIFKTTAVLDKMLLSYFVILYRIIMVSMEVYYTPGLDAGWFVDIAVMNYLVISSSIILAQYSKIVFCFRSQFDSLTEKVEVRRRLNLQLTLKQHGQILKRLKLANSLYEHQILLGCLGNCILLLFNMFLFLKDLRGKEAALKITVNLLYAVYYFLSMVTLCTCCQQATEAADEFSSALLQRAITDQDGGIINVKTFMWLKVKQTTNFTACGFFSIGHPLITSVMTVVATYLVILIQFDAKGKKP